MEESVWTPGKLLGFSGSYWGPLALHAGVKLDVFTALGRGESTAQALASRLKVSPRHLGALLDALAALGLLKKSARGTSNTPLSRDMLCRSSPRYAGHIVLHHHHLASSWARLDESVRKGRPLRRRSTRSRRAERESFLMGMFNLAMSVGPLIVPALPLAGRRHVLDLGGGPGTYSALMCRRFPGLKATVYDLAPSREFARKTIRRFGMEKRVGFMAGDFLRQGIRGRYDAAWLSHILHGEGPQACLSIVKKAVAALEPGGVIMVHEFLLDDRKDGPLFPALFSLNMLLGTSEGRAYSEGEIRELLASAGVRRIERLPLSLPNDSGVIVGWT